MTSWRRALVLGGGGLIGVAWESGLCAGLFEHEVDLRECDAFVGTSAGAINCSRLASGHWPPAPNDPPLPAARGANLDPSQLDAQALGAIFRIWSKQEGFSPAAAREMGALARGLYREREASWIEGIAAIAGANAWPDKPFFVCSVDADSGERAIFDASGGVALGHAIAASAAVPGLFPCVLIGGRLCMDGQIHSSTNADLLLTHPHAQKPDEVVIAMPTNRHTAPAIGAQAERAVETEVAALEAAGCRVHWITPSAEQVVRIGANLMDSAKTGEAYAVGLETGRAWAERLGARGRA